MLRWLVVYAAHAVSTLTACESASESNEGRPKQVSANELEAPKEIRAVFQEHSGFSCEAARRKAVIGGGLIYGPGGLRHVLSVIEHYQTTVLVDDHTPMSAWENRHVASDATRLAGFNTTQQSMTALREYIRSSPAQRTLKYKWGMSLRSYIRDIGKQDHVDIFVIQPTNRFAVGVGYSNTGLLTIPLIMSDRSNLYIASSLKLFDQARSTWNSDRTPLTTIVGSDESERLDHGLATLRVNSALFEIVGEKLQYPFTHVVHNGSQPASIIFDSDFAEGEDVRLMRFHYPSDSTASQ